MEKKNPKALEVEPLPPPKAKPQQTVDVVDPYVDDTKYPSDRLGKWEKRAWNEQKKWQKVADKKRKEERFWRSCKVRLTIAGVLLQTISSQIQGGILSLPFGERKVRLPGSQFLCKRTISVAGGAALALIPVVNSKLTEDRIADVVDSRLVTEELSSEIWKSLAGIGPYIRRDDAAVKTFNEKIRDIIQAEVGLDEPRFGIHPITNLSVTDTEEDFKLEDEEKMPKIGKTTAVRKSTFYLASPLSKVSVYKDRKAMYMDARVDFQLKKKKMRAKKIEKRATYWKNIESALTIGSAAIGTFFNSIGADTSNLGMWSTVLTTSAAAVASHIQASQFEANKNGLYRVVLKLEDLKNEREQNLNEDDLSWETFVEEFETALISQTMKWRQIRLQKNKGKAAKTQ